MKGASLVVVGTGIKFLSHLTNEARAYIEKSDKVLYLVNDPITKEWIREINPNSESMDFLYSKYPLRQDCYSSITKYILEVLRQNLHVCVVLYGHPGVFAQPALDAVIQAKLEGYDAQLLPAISSEDCLFADLLVDPGTFGCQSFEATDFLLYQRKFDPNCNVILWQVDAIGILDNPIQFNNEKGIQILIEYLLEFYKAEHEIVLYEAAQYPGFEPVIQKIFLKKLIKAKFSRLTTLYIPPSSAGKLNKSFLKKFNISLPNLKK